MLANIDWIAIKNEYINGNISYRKLAEKYNIPRSTLEHRAKVERWSISKKEHCGKIEAELGQKTIKISVKQELNRIEKLLKLSDIAGEKLELAFSQVDEYLTASGDVIKGKHIDVDRLRKLISSTKDLKDVIREDKSADNSDIWGEIVREYTKI